MRTPSRRTIALLSVLALGALTAAGCGSSSSTKTTGSVPANAVDRAFVQQMIPHHQMAVQMAGIAGSRSQHAQINALGRSIVATQTAEMAQLSTIAGQLGVSPGAMPAGGTHGAHMGAGTTMDAAAKTLGIPADEMGMAMDMSSLETAKPFDRAFVDMMIPHHQGAIRMARAELAHGQNAQLKTIATAIIAAQTKEIKAMNSWRTAWYGAASPAGGVPSAA